MMEGYWAGSISWNKNPAVQASAHFYIRSDDGHIGQLVSEDDMAWHAGNLSYSQTYIGIEHEGFISNPSWLTDAMYHSSAQLTAYLCDKYDIPADREHIIGHDEVPNPNNPGLSGGIDGHTDPGPHWDWTKYMALVQQIATGGEGSPEQPNGQRRGTDDIVGAAIYPKERLVEFAEANNATEYALELIPAIYEYAPQRNLGADFLCVQMFLETGAGTYQGVSKPYNPAGIKKADAANDAPEDFEVPPNADEGARMQVNHWCAVLGIDPIGTPHGRYWVAKEVYSHRSPIRHISQLGNGNWATDPHYAAKLRHLLDELE